MPQITWPARSTRGTSTRPGPRGSPRECPRLHRGSPPLHGGPGHRCGALAGWCGKSPGDGIDRRHLGGEGRRAAKPTGDTSPGRGPQQKVRWLQMKSPCPSNWISDGEDGQLLLRLPEGAGGRGIPRLHSAPRKTGLPGLTHRGGADLKRRRRPSCCSTRGTAPRIRAARPRRPGHGRRNSGKAVPVDCS